MNSLIRSYIFDNLDIPIKWENVDDILNKDGTIFNKDSFDLWIEINIKEIDRKRYLIQGDKPFKVHSILELTLNIKQGIGLKAIETTAETIVNMFNELVINDILFRTPTITNIGTINGIYKKLIVVSFYYKE